MVMKSKAVREQTLAEEVANALTHALGFILSLLGFYWLLIQALASDDFIKIGSALLFGGSLIVLYGASTLYHAFQRPEIKRALRLADHCAIYGLIAGSYTPFALVTLSGMWGWLLFAVEWALALLGIGAKVYFAKRLGQRELLSTLFYLAMGWLIVIAFSPLLEALSSDGLLLLLAGGLFYTGGAVIYLLEWGLFHHAIWHLFVLGGSSCHFFAVLNHVL